MKQAIFALVFLIVMCGIAVEFDNLETIRYDCSISEISPDYPLAVKEGCRKLKLEQKNI